jgi:hypothetical protein
VRAQVCAGRANRARLPGSGFDTAQDWRKNTPAIAYLLAALPCVEDAQLGRLARLLVASDAALVPECDEAFEAACRKFASSVSLRGPLYAFQAVQPLLVALQKRTSALTELSSVHTDLLQVCVVSRMYTLASRVADVHLTGLARRRDGSKPPRVFAALGAQRYFYYAGVAYAGLRRYEDAARAFMTGLSLPAHTLGAVHVASYKKYVLVSLLARGRLDALPRHLGLGVAHSLELLQQSRGQDLFPYMQLARAFEEQVADSLAGLAGEPMFAAVRVCVLASPRRSRRAASAGRQRGAGRGGAQGLRRRARGQAHHRVPHAVPGADRAGRAPARRGRGRGVRAEHGARQAGVGQD